MAPLLIPADLLEKRSTNVSNNIMIIIFAVVGGLLAITAAIVLYIILTRRASNNGRHSRNLSNTSAPLLKSKSQRRTESVTPPLDHFPLPSDNVHPKVFTNSHTAATTQYEQVRPQSREATPILAVKPSLSSLSIPSHSRHIPTINISPDPTSSESLYSQPSASTFHAVTTPTSTITQHAHIPETADIPTRVDTHTIGELLRERAKRNERSPRKVSSTECAGSVEPAFDSDTSDDDSESVHRFRRFRTERSFVTVPQDTREE